MENRAILSDKLLPYLLILPQFAVSLIFFYWPAMQALQQSFLVQDAFGLSTEFVWFENYVELLQRPEYYQAIGVTFVFSALVVFFSLTLGLLLAAMANRNIAGVQIYRTFLIIPDAAQRHRLESGAERDTCDDPRGHRRGLEPDQLQFPVLPRRPAGDPEKRDRGRRDRRRQTDAAVLDHHLSVAVADHVLPHHRQYHLRVLQHPRHHRHRDRRRPQRRHPDAGLQGVSGRQGRVLPRRLRRSVGDPDGDRGRADRISVSLRRKEGSLLNAMVEHRRFGNLLPHLVLLAGVAIVAFPVHLAVIASTHDNTVIANGQMPLYPGSHGLETYWNTSVSGTGKTTRAPVGGMMLNSLIMALGIAVGKIAISIISAYAIVFFSFPFRMTAFWTIFITLMLPVEVRIFPTYKITSDLHMLDSYAGLILPLIASATATLLFRQFFMTVPKELVEASKIDGAGPIRFFWDTLLPLSVTNIAALFVILFIYGWNQYLWPLLITTRDDMQTIVIGIKKIIDVHDALTEWQVAMATAVLAMLPPVAVVVLMQRLFVKGLIETEK